MGDMKKSKRTLNLPAIDYSERNAATYPSDEWQRANMRVIAAQILNMKMEYYYGTPTADDQEYDLWWNNLLKLEAQYPHLKAEPSVTDNPGAPLPSEVERYLK
jgi:NAD-dependent DNA ligase